MKLRCIVLLSALTLLGPLFAFAESNSESSAKVVTVSAQQAKQLHELGATFIDVRPNDEWALGHIKNAVHVEFNNDFNRIKNLQGLAKDSPLVIYCSSSECQSGALASAVSVFWGFTQVYYFADGYFSWILEDYPVVMNLTATLN